MGRLVERCNFGDFNVRVKGERREGREGGREEDGGERIIGR